LTPAIKKALSSNFLRSDAPAEPGLDAGWRQNSLRAVVLDIRLGDLAAPRDEVVNLALALKWCPVCSALLKCGRPVKDVFSDAARRGERPASCRFTDLAGVARKCERWFRGRKGFHFRRSTGYKT
jgi:hypothetical protein